MTFYDSLTACAIEEGEGGRGGGGEGEEGSGIIGSGRL